MRSGSTGRAQIFKNFPLRPAQGLECFGGLSTLSLSKRPAEMAAHNFPAHSETRREKAGASLF
jgi:hypothetical protein